MKNILLPLVFILALQVESFSQCNPLIYPSPGCTNITTNTTINDPSGGCYWICSGLTINVTASGGSAYYLEQNVILNIIGSNGDQIFAKPGCIINNSSADNMGVTADTSTITMNNTGSGSLTVDAVCTPLTYDYSLVGGGGSPCNTVMGIKENEKPLVKLFPNLVNQGSPIQIEAGNIIIEKIKIVDVSGQLIQTINGNLRTISTAGLEKGNYFVQVSSGQSVQTLKIVVI